MGANCQTMKYIKQQEQVLIIEQTYETNFDDYKEETKQNEIQSTISKISTFQPKFLNSSYSYDEKIPQDPLFEESLTERLQIKIPTRENICFANQAKGILKVRTFQKGKLKKGGKRVSFSSDTRGEEEQPQQRLTFSKFIIQNKNTKDVSVFF